MRYRSTVLGTIAGVAVILGLCGALASRAEAVSEGGFCLTEHEAGLAMGTPVVHAKARSSEGTECVYDGAPRKGAAPTVLLDTWVSRPGAKLALDGLKKSLCKIANLLDTEGAKKACGAAKLALQERDPVRLVRLLFVIAENSGTATTWVGAGSSPGYLWLPDASTELTGSFVLFYEVGEKRFVSVHCNAIYKHGGQAPLCVSNAAKRLYAELVS